MQNRPSTSSFYMSVSQDPQDSEYWHVSVDASGDSYEIMNAAGEYLQDPEMLPFVTIIAGILVNTLYNVGKIGDAERDYYMEELGSSDFGVIKDLVDLFGED